MTMLRVVLCQLIVWHVLFPVTSTCLAQGRVHDLRVTGPSASRLDLVVLAEGYTATQENKFVVDATRLVESFLAVEPYCEYASYFNVRAIYVASNQPGSDHPLSGVWRDTYFNSSYDTSGVNQVLTVPPNDRDPVYAHGLGRIDALVQALTPERDLVWLLVNDIEYGGSGGSVLISSLSSASAELVLHESGHTLGLLADEYSDPYPSTPREMPNATAVKDRQRIPWAAWIAPETPVPTPATAQYAEVVGLFEGAQYQSRGWYRPRFDCRMRTLGQPFCEVCTEQLIRRIYQFSRPAENPVPATTSVEVTNADEVTFEITPAQPRTHPIEVRWFVGGVEQAGAVSGRFVLGVKNLTNGWYSLSCQAADRTAWVRVDPEHRLVAIQTWQVHVARSRLELGTPVRDTTGGLRVAVSGVAPRGFIIQRSLRPNSWDAVLTNATIEGAVEVKLPWDPAVGAALFRAVAR